MRKITARVFALTAVLALGLGSSFQGPPVQMACCKNPGMHCCKNPGMQCCRTHPNGLVATRDGGLRGIR
jgi:hypothetical protein